jgi:predicted permease
MFDILLLVLPVFLVVGLGYSLRGTGLVDTGFLAQMNRLVYFVAVPIMFFYKIAQSDFSASFNARILAGILICIGTIAALSYLYGGVRHYDKARRGAFCQAAFRGNLVYIALPIVYSAYGEAGFAVAGIIIGFMTAVVNFLSIFVLMLPHRHVGPDLKASFWVHQIVFNPLISSSFLGIIWSYFRLPIPMVLANAFDIISGMTLPLALIVIGASFSFQKLQGEMTITMIATTVKIVLMPLTAGIILYMLGVRGMEFGVGILLTGAPVASTAYIMAQQLKGDADLTSTIIMFSTLISVLSYTLYLYILKVIGI